MATNTCMSIIQYLSDDDRTKEPFYTVRDEFALGMYNQGKCETFPNYVPGTTSYGNRLWIDHAAAQEFIDWIVANAPTYDTTIVSTAIEDLVQ
jgi:hypothetical protein